MDEQERCYREADGLIHPTEDFVHRCGRTGRAGKSGKAVTFFTGEGHEKALAGEFMRVLRDVGAPVSSERGPVKLWPRSGSEADDDGSLQIPKEMDRFPSTIKKRGECRRITFRRGLILTIRLPPLQSTGLTAPSSRTLPMHPRLRRFSLIDRDRDYVVYRRELEPSPHRVHVYL